MPVRPRILLIDEDPADRALTTVVLASAFPGAIVCEVGDAANAVSALRDGEYDVVVTEIGLQGAPCGFQIEAMRAISPRARLLVFTSEAEPERHAEVTAAGADELVVKSTEGYVELSHALRDLSTREGSAAAESQARATPRRESTPTSPSGASPAPGWRARLGAGLTDLGATWETGLGKTLVALLGVVAASALLTILLSAAGEDDAPAGPEEPQSVVLGQAVEDPTAAADEPLETVEPAVVPEFVPAVVPEPPLSPEPPPITPTAPVTVELRATDTVWILATVDGETETDVILQRGQTRLFEAERHVELRIGNAAGLVVFWNGADIGSLGRPDQVRRLHFTPTAVGPGPPPAD